MTSSSTSASTSSLPVQGVQKPLKLQLKKSVSLFAGVPHYRHRRLVVSEPAKGPSMAIVMGRGLAVGTTVDQTRGTISRMSIVKLSPI